MKKLTHLLLISLIFLVLGCQEPEEKKEIIRFVKTQIVSDPDILRSRPFPGVIRAEDRVNLSFRVDGPLIKFPVDVGDRVKRDQIIVRIDPKDFEVALQNAKANLEKSKASLTFAKNDYQRALRIQEKDPGAISERMVDKRKEEENKLIAEVKAFESQVEAARDQLKYTFLKAPFDGIIVATYVDNFEFVGAKQAVLRMLNTSRVEMVVDLPEHIITHIPSIKAINVTLDVFPGKEFSATVKEVGTEASTTTRTYPVTLVMDQPKDALILAGMSGEAKITGKIKDDQTERAVTIPLSAIFSDKESEKSFVWIIDENNLTVNRREVKLGQLVKEGVRVVDGLQPGERIATAGVNFLADDQKIRISD